MSFTSKRSSRDARKLRSYVDHDHEQKSELDRPIEASGSSSLKKKTFPSGLYANLPSSVEIRSHQGKGRGVWCKKIIKRGNIVLTRQPHVAVLGTQNLPLHCSHCICASGRGFTLKRCAKCKTVWYCSQVCQNNDWNLHKHECSAIQNWLSTSTEGSPPGEAIRSLGRILWGRKVEGNSSVWWQEIKALQSHRFSIPSSATESYTQLAHALVRYIRATSLTELENFGIHSSGDLVDLISQFSTNTFTLASPSLTPLGTCVSPVAALFNHSCFPNAVIVFPRQSSCMMPTSGLQHRGPLLHVIAIRDIPAEEEILTAYVDTSLPTSLRQQSLRETYNFQCRCELCAPEASDLDPREALWCPKLCGGMCPFPESQGNRGTIPRCITCKAQFTQDSLDDIESKLRIGREALEKATSLQFSDPHRALNLTTNILPLLSPLVPASSHPVLGLLRLRQALLIPTLGTTIDVGILNDAIRLSARVVSGLMSVFVEGHPVRGISLAELGKLLAVDEPPPSSSVGSDSTGSRMDAFPPTGAARLALAIDTLKRALNELTVGFGEKTGGGDIGQEIRETIVRLEEEISIYERGVRNALRNNG